MNNFIGIKGTKLKYLFLLIAVFLAGKCKSQTYDAISPLTFDDVFAGYSETANYTETAAARFRFNVTSNNKTVKITFTLPSTLKNGTLSVPITFSSSNAAYKISTDLSTSGSTLFNPYVALQKNLGTTRKIVVWLGATVSPAANASSGTYSGSIIVTTEIL